MILNNDNEETRQLVEHCYMQAKTTINPIIDWTDAEVWEFIHEYNVPYCELYDQGFKRLGCIGCPMGGSNGMTKEFERYPKYKNLYLKAFERMVEENRKNGIEMKWETADDVMSWWLQETKGETNETF